MGKKYGQSFYNERHSNTVYSARRIIDIVNHYIHPESVVDVGCGVGTWLKVFQDAGVKEILGVEGQWVDDNSLVIPEKDFIKADLEKEFNIDRKFDLAISLEVAEHIQEQFSDRFVKNIADLAPVVMFSAAIPLQMGKHHVNEQWPDYWKRKFEKQNYVILDCIRPQIWEDDRMEMWYAQNTFIYVDKSRLSDYPELEKVYTENPSRLSAVLPRFYEYKLKTWPIMKAIRNRVKRVFN